MFHTNDKTGQWKSPKDIFTDTYIINTADVIQIKEMLTISNSIFSACNDKYNGFVGCWYCEQKELRQGSICCNWAGACWLNIDDDMFIVQFNLHNHTDRRFYGFLLDAAAGRRALVYWRFQYVFVFRLVLTVSFYITNTMIEKNIDHY